MRIVLCCVQAAGICVSKHGAMESIPSRAEVDVRMGALTS